jgi:hypothetical protein
LLKSSKTILWNGPVGVFEFDQFGNGTKVLAQAIAESPAFSIAGGGDTLAAIDKYGVGDKISYIPRAAARSSSSSRAKCCLPWKFWNNAPRPEYQARVKGSEMVKPLPLLIMAGLLVGCASEPEAGTAPNAAPELLQVSCYQAGWQAETVPIVYKRGGPESGKNTSSCPLSDR